MNLFISLETGLREIFSHKFRSFLSMLGIVLGVGSLIATMAITGGIERGTRAFMEQIGGLEMVNVVNKEISNDLQDFWNLSPGRTLQDAYAIKQAAPLVSHVSPQLDLGLPVSSGGQTMRVRVSGVWPDFLEIARHQIAAGRFIGDLDVDRGQRCAVIGNTIAATLWPNLAPADTVGQTIYLNDSPFTVVGVFTLYERDRDRLARERGLSKVEEDRRERRGTRPNRGDPFRGKNEAVLIPFTTMFYEFKSAAFPDNSSDTVPIENLTIRIGNLKSFEQALGEVRKALEITHRGVDDFGFDTREDWFDQMEQRMRSTRTSGGLIAGISLLVGAIGITNIMLASITERVREIGIRRAVGARARDIFLQIIVESVSIALMGGVIGVVVGFGIVQLLTLLAPGDSEPFISAASIGLSIGFAAVVGVLSGIYPAVQASRLDPIQALRYE
ncbi:MAG: ABC transporter permease [Terrimicrobiaceae bacterium]|nr:ABC transporter permease [Terrimicrobiaceae bacterium]